jgi:hypothetical protein
LQVLASAAARIAVFLITVALVWSGLTIGVRMARQGSLPSGFRPGSTPAPADLVVARDTDVPAMAELDIDAPEPDAPRAPEAPSLPAQVELPIAPVIAIPDVPRVPLVSQFDGGTMQNANCTLAAGAMLARSAFGIRTSGSRLRQLQDDQSGGTSLAELQTALYRGYGVTVVWNAITPDQLHALLTVGAGVVVQGDYSRIPADWRLQRSFAGGHAIYLDGYIPGWEGQPAAYFVIDPLGRGRYAGAWWHAAVVEDFAVSFAGRGRVAAAWAPP